MRTIKVRTILGLAGLSAALWGQPSPVTAVMTDQAGLETRGKFGQANFYVMGENGDVYFTSGGNSALFQWTPGTGKKRLLQANDPVSALGLPPQVLAELPPGGIVDTMTQLQTFGSGQLALVASAAIKGERDPAGVVYWDGAGFRVVDAPVDTINQFFVNGRGRLALAGSSDPLNLGPAQILMETASGEVVKVAEQGQPAAGGVGGAYAAPTLIGHTNNGQVAFLAGIAGGSTPLALYVTDGGPPRVLVKTGDSASGTGTFALRGAAANYFMNNEGQVAFAADSNGGPAGIWVVRAGAAPVKLFRLNDSTGVDLGGTFVAPFALRDFNDAGNALFSANLAGAGSTHGLFVRNAGTGATQTVFAKGVPAWEGVQFDTAMQAAMSQNGKVAFLASLTGGSANFGWFLGAAGEAAVKIVAEGDPAPGGGKFGLAGRLSGAIVNTKGQVAFAADVLESNASGMFWWAPGGEVAAVMTTSEDLPEGASPVLRAGPPMSSDTETVVRAYRAGGSATYYAVSLAGDRSARRIVGDFDALGDTAVLLTPNNFSFNSNGEAVFQSAVLGAGAYPRQALLASSPAAGLSWIAATGDEAPGGGRFVSFGPPQLNNRPEVVFFANLDSGAGIFSAAADPPGLRKIARVGDAWPGGPAGATFGGLSNVLSVNDKGQVAFQGNSTNPVRPGLFVGTAEEAPVKIVEVTAAAPVGTFNGLMAPYRITASGEVVFVANYAGPAGGGSGVFLGKAGGSPQPLATSGARVQGAGNSTFQFFNPASLISNNSGMVGFWAGTCCTINTGWFTAAADGTVQTRIANGQTLPGGAVIGSVSPGQRLAALSESGELAVFAPDLRETPMAQQILAVGTDGTIRRLAGSGEPAADKRSEYGKLIGSVTVTPGGRFVFSAILVNGPAKAGVFVSNPR